MYSVFFSALANGQLADVVEARDVLREALESMEAEQPAVVVEDDAVLAGAVARAVEFVDPGLKDGQREGAIREWWKWYERCSNVENTR